MSESESAIETTSSKVPEIVYTYETHMWDKLPEIQNNAVSGAKMLKEFQNMCNNYNSALTKFASELHKCNDQFQKYANGAFKKVDQNYFGIKIGQNKPDEKKKEPKDQIIPLQDSVEAMLSGLQNISSLVEERVLVIVHDVIEPLDMYLKHNLDQNNDNFEKAKEMLHDLHEQRIKHNECKLQFQNCNVTCE